ncbi:hypothetical protein HN51_008838 [Arachis hypogaea]|uniref:double-stranded RNA-binding protein 4 isoform X2 n=1 Tax=Arachis hypogaea TaxID=3818 RepID=UPI000DED209E|nr:double-stranded RNA-binding protein 4 [Arachis hypogaea]QHO43207.1 Double-stranded RNA-binding protein [Arachis hypogaea]
MHKNKLQEYLQKSGFPLPVYRTDNEGFAHAPKFRSTVVVNGREFKSRLTYSHRKEAEQDAAELALKIIIHDTNNIEECTVLPDLIYCKSILNEYAVQKNIGSPQYTTTQKSELHPVFISTLVFNGRIYTGQVGKSKKEAEQLAAFVTIQSLLDSSSCQDLHQIIKSKLKMPTKLHHAKQSAPRTSSMFLEGSSKQMTDTPGPIKRKLDSINLESKKQTREPGFQVMNVAFEKTRGKRK